MFFILFPSVTVFRLVQLEYLQLIVYQLVLIKTVEKWRL